MADKEIQPISAATQNTAASEELRALYYSYLEHCNAHKFKGMESFYTSPININDEPWAPSKVTEQFGPLIAAFPDWHWEIRHLTIENGFIALHFRITGTHQGNFHGIEPTGRLITTTQFTLYRVEEGKFTDVWDDLDIDSIVKQIKQDILG